MNLKILGPAQTKTLCILRGANEKLGPIISRDGPDMPYMYIM